jgi:hypothetical protein
MITPPRYPTNPSDRPWVLFRCDVTMQALYSRLRKARAMTKGRTG